jgi:hypothetical protein
MLTTTRRACGKDLGKGQANTQDRRSMDSREEKKVPPRWVELDGFGGRRSGNGKNNKTEIRPWDVGSLDCWIFAAMVVVRQCVWIEEDWTVKVKMKMNVNIAREEDVFLATD